MTPDSNVNVTELNKVVREMQNASDTQAKQSPLFSQQAADIIRKAADEKRATRPSIKLT